MFEGGGGGGGADMDDEFKEAFWVASCCSSAPIEQDQLAQSEL